MARLTRHQLKEDAFRTTFEEYEAFAKEHAREIVLTSLGVVALIGLVVGLRATTNRFETSANAQLGEALKTFHAYVGTAAPGVLGPGDKSFATAEQKYKTAMAEFSAASQVKGLASLFPRPKATRIARYYVGVCEAQLGDQPAATKTLEEVSRDSDPNIASLAKYALASEMAVAGKTSDAVKIYQSLIDHPTGSVSRAMAQMGMADAYRASQPAQARQIYRRMQAEYGSDPLMAEVIKQQVSTLPQ